VLIPDGDSEHALWVARSLAHSKRVRLYILSNQCWTPVRFSRHFDILLPVSEEGVLFAAAERETLSKLAALPPIPDLESLRIARHKWLLNQFACQHNLPAPESALVTLDSAFDQRISALEYPVLLKPPSLTDGQGIRRFDTLSDLRRFLKGPDGTLFEGKYLFQTYVPGSDLGLSVLCQDGGGLGFHYAARDHQCRSSLRPSDGYGIH
jgi:predicted ATP-grasp superfamily ATP-dependent carboligase